MKSTRIFPQLAAALIAASSAHATILTVPDFSLTPDGTTASPLQTYDINANNPGSIVNSTFPVAYFVTRFVFGPDTLADIQLNFAASAGQDRLGIRITDNGIANTIGDGADSSIDFDFDGAGVNPAGTMAGQTVTIIGKFLYDATFSATYGETNTSNDSFATFWINPTVSALEGSGLPNNYGNPDVPNANFTGDFASPLWNSSSFFLLEQRIFNNSTPDGNDDSSIVNTTILTGTNATFANALALAIPEPSAALLGGLGLLALLRRRRNA
jgi:hypothetical protein